MAALLPPHFNFVAVDLPGHGLSSHKPAGTLYNIYDWIPDVRRIILHLGWSRYSLIAHSMGVPIGTGYVACYPEEVLAMVALDLIEAKTVPAASTRDHLTELIRNMLTFEGTKGYAVDVEEAVRMLRRPFNGSLTAESAKIMLIRGSAPVGNGKVTFTRDPHLRFLNTTGVVHAQALSLASSVRAHVLIFASAEGIAFNASDSSEIEETVEAFRSNAKSFRLERVPGTHHFHMNDASVITPEVVSFLEMVHSENAS